MSDSTYTAIRVEESVKEDADEARRDNETWNEFVRRCSENPPETIKVVRVSEFSDELAEIIREELDRDGVDPDDVATAAERGAEKAVSDLAR